MQHDLVFKNALVVAPIGVFRGGVAIDGEEIVALGASSALGAGRREIDLDSKILLPGLFDPHLHFGVGDEIGEESMVEDFLHSTKDCLVGGVTTIATTSLLGRTPLSSSSRKRFAAAPTTPGVRLLVSVRSHG